LPTRGSKAGGLKPNDQADDPDGESRADGSQYGADCRQGRPRHQVSDVRHLGGLVLPAAQDYEHKTGDRGEPPGQHQVVAVGHANGTATVIQSLGKVPGIFNDSVYFRWALPIDPLFGE
jgi:hypothetical protein